MSDIKFAVYAEKETVLESFYKDFITAVMVAFGVYISQGSTMWEFITGSMFLLFIFTKISKVIKKQNNFKTKADLQAWVDSLHEA